MCCTLAILARSAALLPNFHFLMEDIILKFVETFSDKYGIEDLKIAGFDVIFCDVINFAFK